MTSLSRNVVPRSRGKSRESDIVPSARGLAVVTLELAEKHLCIVDYKIHTQRAHFKKYNVSVLVCVCICVSVCDVLLGDGDNVLILQMPRGSSQ